jgi:hypothetical protein
VDIDPPVPAGPLGVGESKDIAELSRVGEGTRELLLGAGLSTARIDDLAATRGIKVEDR